MSEFEFNLDRGKRLLTVVMRGFWDARIYQAYDAQLRLELAALNRLPAPRACLVDAREFAIQCQEVADMMREGVQKRLHLYPERTVRLVSRAISRSQAARMTSVTNQRVFETLETAIDWLFSDAPQPNGASTDGTAAAA